MDELQDGKMYFYLYGYRVDKDGNEIGEMSCEVFESLEVAKRACRDEIENKRATGRVVECIANEVYGVMELEERVYHTPLIDDEWEVFKIDY